MDAHLKEPDPLTKKLTPYYRDFLEVSGNQYRPGRVMPGTCEACVWGSGQHACLVGFDPSASASQCEEKQADQRQIVHAATVPHLADAAQ